LGEQQAHSWESAVSGIIPLPVDCVSSLGQEHRLVFLKSIMVGVVTMVSAAICSGIAVIIVLAFKSRNLPDGQTINWDPVSLLRSSSTAWLILLISFAFGFWWEYRKAKP